MAVRPLCTVSQPSESFLPTGGHKGPCDDGSRWIQDSGYKRRLTQFVHRGGERLAGFSDGVIALDSVGPTGACVGEAARSHGRWRATEGGKHTVCAASRLFFQRRFQSKKFQPSEDSAYQTRRHSAISRDRIGQQPLHHDQYPFPAASDYRAVHILNGCFSSL